MVLLIFKPFLACFFIFSNKQSLFSNNNFLPSKTLKIIAFKFPLIQEDDITYAILTQEECNTFRQEMEIIISKLNA